MADQDRRMPFFKHLEELRKRLVVSLIAIGVGFFATYSFSAKLLVIIQKPLNRPLIFLSPTEAFWVDLLVALFAGILLAAPVILYQMWKFVAPGLLQKEKRYIVPFTLFSTLFFSMGVCFAYFIALPLGLRFLLGFATADLQPMLSLSKYVTFFGKLLLAFGVMFEFPVVIFLLTRLGILQPQTLAKNRKYAILGIFVVSALLTPPDVISQILLAIPLVGLFELSLLVSRIVRRKEEKKKVAEEHLEAIP